MVKSLINFKHNIMKETSALFVPLVLISVFIWFIYYTLRVNGHLGLYEQRNGFMVYYIYKSSIIESFQIKSEDTLEDTKRKRDLTKQNAKEEIKEIKKKNKLFNNSKK